MKKRNLFSGIKKIFTGSLTVLVVMAGVSITTKAATDDTVKYESLKMSEYWGENKKIAPVEKGYVFAGWYASESEEQPLDKCAEGNAYAKFVPATVLSIKTQANAETVEAKNLNEVQTGETLRVLSSVDSGKYQKVGFKVLFGTKEIDAGTHEYTKVYSNLTYVGKDGKVDNKTATEVFGSDASRYFFAADIIKIASVNYSNQIYVCPYWVTLDGTTVYGQASNVFLEDHCADKNYYRASVNLFGGQDVAAGKVSVKYNSDSFEFVDVKVGRMFKNEIESNESNGTVTIVGNASTVNTHEQAGDLLMTVRFTKKANADAASVSFTDFTSQFCDWNEKDVTGIVVQ